MNTSNGAGSRGSRHGRIHKPGQTAARNYDNSNNVIYDPQTANRGGYTSFCGYLFGPSGMQIL